MIRAGARAMTKTITGDDLVSSIVGSPGCMLFSVRAWRIRTDCFSGSAIPRPRSAGTGEVRLRRLSWGPGLPLPWAAVPSRQRACRLAGLVSFKISALRVDVP